VCVCVCGSYTCRSEWTHRHTEGENCAAAAAGRGPTRRTPPPPLVLSGWGLEKKDGKKKKTTPIFFLPGLNPEFRCKPLHRISLHPVWGWRAKRSADPRLPRRKESWSRASSYTCALHLCTPLTPENPIVKKGKCPNPLHSFTTVVSQTFFIYYNNNNDYIGYIFSIKSMPILCLFFLMSSFSKKIKIKKRQN